MTDATHTQANDQNAREQHPSNTQTRTAEATCCGGPAPSGADACCARDADVKSAGGAGCGCGSAPAVSKKTACCA